MGTVNGRKRGSKKVNFRMATILRVLLLCTFFVSSCLSAPKFQLIETEDDGEEGAPDEVDPPQKEVDPDDVDPPEDEVDPPPVESSQEESLEDGEGADYQGEFMSTFGLTSPS